MSRDTVYLKIPQIREVDRKDVCLGDIADIHCQNKNVEARCRAIRVVSFRENGRRDAVYTGNILDLIKKIEETGQQVDVNSMGETEFLVKYRRHGKPNMIWEWTKTLFVSAVSFFGAAFAIMTFNNDANVGDVFSNIYRIVIGTEAEGPTILEFSYSVGLAVGILVFFNHFASWKITVDPTPIEVEMRLYEESVNKTLLQNSGRKESGVDVS